MSEIERAQEAGKGEAVRELVRVGVDHWNDTKGAPYENI